MKTCTKCGAEKEPAAFSRDKYATDGLRYQCRICSTHSTTKWAEKNRQRLSDYGKRRRKENPDKVRAEVTKSHYKTKYGLSLGDLNNMRDQQNGQCAICKTPFPILGKPNRSQVPQVDHCHATGKVRGLLCSPCNIALGLLKDDFFTVIRAASYLKKFLT